MSKLSVFVSSTVKDFGPLRRDLHAWLAARGIEARLSDHNDFPVAPGVHSHDACLHAIQGANLFLLLVGNRYGGRYKGTPKSITWREYDEAFAHRIPIVALVLRSTNDLAMSLAAGNKPKKHEEPPKDFDRVMKFIDHIRKGHRDNWSYLEWDGSLTASAEILQSTLNNLLVEYQAPVQKLRSAAERAVARASAQRDLARLGHELAAAVARRTISTDDALAKLLRLVGQSRAELLGFENGDVWNMQLYRREGNDLRPWLRECDPQIERHERAWRIGEGHAGLAVSSVGTLVAGDLSVVDGFAAQFPSDTKVYRSAVSMPLSRPGAKAAKVEDVVGAFVITSNRLDHFVELGQLEVLTAEQIGSTLNLVATAWADGKT